LLMSIDSDGFVGLDDLERRPGSRQPEYRAGGAVAVPERRTKWQSDEVAVKLDGWLEMLGAPRESDRTDRGQFLRPSSRLSCHGVDAKTSTGL
jgi:hypothetical protein